MFFPVSTAFRDICINATCTYCITLLNFFNYCQPSQYRAYVSRNTRVYLHVVALFNDIVKVYTNIRVWLIRRLRLLNNIRFYVSRPFYSQFWYLPCHRAWSYSRPLFNDQRKVYTRQQRHENNSRSKVCFSPHNHIYFIQGTRIRPYYKNCGYVVHPEH